MSKPSLSDIDKLDVKIIQHFRKTGEAAGVPEHIANYILQLDKAVEIYNHEGNISRAARKLIEEFPDLAFPTAKTRIYDAINFFHLNNTVKNEAWDQYYADRLEDLAKVALKSQNLTEARRCFQLAHTLRTKRDENAINPDDLKIKDQVLSPDINPERLGLKKFSLKDLWKESAELIEELDIDSVNKEKLKAETAQTLGVDYEGGE